MKPTKNLADNLIILEGIMKIVGIMIIDHRFVEVRSLGTLTSLRPRRPVSQSKHQLGTCTRNVHN